MMAQKKLQMYRTRKSLNHQWASSELHDSLTTVLHETTACYTEQWKSHQAPETTHSRTVTLFVMPFLHAHESISNEI